MLCCINLPRIFYGVSLCPKFTPIRVIFFVGCLQSLKSKKTLMSVRMGAKSRAFWRLSSKVAKSTAKNHSY